MLNQTQQQNSYAIIGGRNPVNQTQQQNSYAIIGGQNPVNQTQQQNSYAKSDTTTEQLCYHWWAEPCKSNTTTEQLCYHWWAEPCKSDTTTEQLCYHWWAELPQVSFLSWQNVCHNKHVFVATKVSLLWQNICCNKIMFLATKVLSRQKYVCTLSLQKTCFVTTNMSLSWQNFCRDKNDTCGISCQWCYTPCNFYIWKGWVGGNQRLFQAFAVTCLVGLPCRSERHWVQVGVPSDQSPWGSLQRLPSVLWRQQWPHGIHPAPLVRRPRATQGVRFSARLVPAIDSTWRVSQKRQKDLSHLWSLPHGNASKYKVRKLHQNYIRLLAELRSLYLLACQVRGNAGDWGLCCFVCVASFEH